MVIRVNRGERVKISINREVGRKRVAEKEKNEGTQPQEGKSKNQAPGINWGGRGVTRQRHHTQGWGHVGGLDKQTREMRKERRDEHC